MESDLERYIVQVSQRSRTSYNQARSIVYTQIVMAVADLAIGGEAQTIIGVIQRDADGGLSIKEIDPKIKHYMSGRINSGDLIREIINHV